MPAFLIPIAEGSPIPIDKPILFFGRHEDCDVALLTSRKVSRKHCVIAVVDDHFVIRDLGSMNGVKINQEVVRREGKFAVGDEVSIGDVAFRLEVLDALPKKKGGAVPAGPARPVVAEKPKLVPPKRLADKPVPHSRRDEKRPVVMESSEEVPLSSSKMNKLKRGSAKSSRPKRKKTDSGVIELDDVDLVDE